MTARRSRVFVLASALAAASWLASASSLSASRGSGANELGFSFANIAGKAGLTARTVYGGQGTNKYLLETTGTGVAAFDYDGDGWVDIFLVNGTTLEGFPAGQAPTNHLYRNRHDGTFEDVTSRAGLAASGWGQGACTGDFDNNGQEDLFVTYCGQNKLYRNKGDGTFDDVTAGANVSHSRSRWSTGCAFLDYDRDGRLDLIVANKGGSYKNEGSCGFRL